MSEQPRPEVYDPPGTVTSAPSPGGWEPAGSYGGAPRQETSGGPGGMNPGQDDFGDTFIGGNAFHETMTAGPEFSGSGYAEPAPAQPSYPGQAYRDPVYPDPTAHMPAYAEPGYNEPGYAEPGYPPAGYPPSGYPPQPGYGEPGQPGPGRPGPGRRPPGQRNKIIFIAVAVVFFLAAGGGAYALVAGHSHGSTAAPPTQSATTAQSAPSSPTAPTTAPPTSASASASASSGTGVAVASAAADNAAAAQVTTFLNSYFTAINNHDYQAYDALLDQQLQPYPQSSFEAGYGSTTDSNETLTSITDTGSGNEAAAVTFTSHQQPSESPDNSACDNWSITLFLVPNGSGYLEGSAPSGYHAHYQAC